MDISESDLKQFRKGNPKKKTSQIDSQLKVEREKKRQYYHANKDKILTQRKIYKDSQKKSVCENRQIPELFAPYISFVQSKGHGAEEKIILTFQSRNAFFDLLINFVRSGDFSEEILERMKKLQTLDEANEELKGNNIKQ